MHTASQLPERGPTDVEKSDYDEMPILRMAFVNLWLHLPKFP